MLKVGINGFGRIGRIAFRIGLSKHSSEIEFAAINTSGSMPCSGWAHLVNYDTTYRKFEKEVKSEEVKAPEAVTDDDPLMGYLSVGTSKIPLLAQKDPAKIPWGKYGVDVVIESTGKFTTPEDAKKHSAGGAKVIIISAPVKGGNVGTYIIGVNDFKGETDVLSNSSCTTNCVAPVIAVLHSKFGIEKAALTTAHGYTDDQNLQDNSNKDLRRARAAAENIVPTTTGAAVSTTETIPELKGLFDGRALRVPVITGSIIDIAAVLKKDTSVEEVNQAFIEASQNQLYKGILAVSDEPLVSSDIVGRDESAIVDLSLGCPNRPFDPVFCAEKIMEPRGRGDEHKFRYSQITDQIYIGSDFCKGGVCLLHSEEFKALGVKVELNLSQEENELPPKELEVYCWLPVADGDSPSPQQFDIGSGIINDAVEAGKTVYVHCKNGHGRSPSVVAAYLIRFKGYSLADAVGLIEEKRPESHIEEIQKEALRKFAEKWSK